MESEEKSLRERLRNDCIAAVAVGEYSPSNRVTFVRLLMMGMPTEDLLGHIPAATVTKARGIMERCTGEGISVVPVTSPHYPALLRHIPNPPAALYVRASEPFALDSGRCIAVVGTRAAPLEACQRATDLAQQLATRGWTVVSGLALGIDGAAHRGALLRQVDWKGTVMPTVAVLAHGLDRVYPPSHQPLAEGILASGGALVSEYPPGTEAFKHHFLERNRIIAGISRGVAVMQAGSSSGSLVTARCAADFGRDVFVFRELNPDQRHAGGQQMLEDGAIPFSGVGEILAEYGFSGGASPLPKEGEAVPIDEYLARHGITPAQLLELELSGEVQRLPGNFVRAHIARAGS